MNHSVRTLTPYEQTQLTRHNLLPHSAAELKAFLDIHGEAPVEYITGHVDFCDLDFLITRDTLIPRIETEELVALAFKHSVAILEQKGGSHSLVFADVGTGCGAIGICLYHKLTEWSKQNKSPISISAVLSEISPSALRIAQKNIERLIPDMAKNSTLLQSDILKDYPAQKFDVLIANLPYIPSERLSQLDASVVDFEPHIALDGGSDGLKYIRRLFEEAVAYMSPQGVILLEVDYTHDSNTWREWNDTWQIQLIFDQFTRNRFVLAKLK